MVGIVNLFHFMFAGDSIFQLYIFVPLIVVAIYTIYMILSNKIFAYKGGLKSNEGSK